MFCQALFDPTFIDLSRSGARPFAYHPSGLPRAQTPSSAVPCNGAGTGCAHEHGSPDLIVGAIPLRRWSWSVGRRAAHTRMGLTGSGRPMLASVGCVAAFRLASLHDRAGAWSPPPRQSSRACEPQYSAPLMKPLLCFITRLWRGYMHKALKLSMAQVEAREA